MTKIIIDIEPVDGSESCGDCRFMDGIEGACALFDTDIYCDALAEYMRCERCLEREMNCDD